MPGTDIACAVRYYAGMCYAMSGPGTELGYAAARSIVLGDEGATPSGTKLRYLPTRAICGVRTETGYAGLSVYARGTEIGRGT
eukprot:3377107-Rhodomonas_salina.12